MPATSLQISEFLRAATAQLAAAGVQDPRCDAQLLLAHVLSSEHEQVSRGQVQARALRGETLSPPAWRHATKLCNLRADRVPLQHLTGQAPFRHLTLSVGPGVFVPRPETELLAELAILELRRAGATENLCAIDLCTGSGAVALALALEVPKLRVWAVEKSAQAHAWAARNVENLGAQRVTLLHGDIADFVPGKLAPAELAAACQVVVANPPYVPDGAVPRTVEVRDHDPHIALYGGPDGLQVIRTITALAKTLLLPGGTLLVEHAEQQGAEIRQLFTRAGYAGAQTYQDLNGRDRVTSAVLPN